MHNNNHVSNYGCPAYLFSIPDSCDNISIPVSDEKGKTPTLNKSGYMMNENDPISDKFISFSKYTELPCLDIGAAYGSVTKQALHNEATVIANDIDIRHLHILKKMAPQKHINRLYLKKGSFPSEIEFNENSLDAVLLRRVIHFLTPEEVETGLKKVFRWLDYGGRVFIAVISPYHTYFTDYINAYNKKWNDNDPWPGVINNFKEFVPDQAEQVPDFVHVMDERPLRLALENTGFNVVESMYFTNNTEDEQTGSTPPSLLNDGKHGVFGIIAEK